MTKIPGDVAPSLLTSIWDLLLMAKKRITATKYISKLDHVYSITANDMNRGQDLFRATPLQKEDEVRRKLLRDRQYPSNAEYWLAAVAFRDAAAMRAVACQSPSADGYENQRLAELFRSGMKNQIAAEHELRNTTILVELAKDYFGSGAANNGRPLEVAQATSALRNLLADEISRGARPEPKPAFKQQYIAFQRELIARSRAGGGRPNSTDGITASLP